MLSPRQTPANSQCCSPSCPATGTPPETNQGVLEVLILYTQRGAVKKEKNIKVIKYEMLLLRLDKHLLHFRMS